MACEITIKNTKVPEQEFISFLEDQIAKAVHPASKLPRLAPGQSGEIMGVKFEVPTEQEQEMMRGEKINPETIMEQVMAFDPSDYVLADYIIDMRESGEDFGIVSAMNPDGMLLDYAANNALHSTAMQWMKDKGLHPKNIMTLKDGKPVKSIFAEDMTAEMMYDFINEFRQPIGQHSTAAITPQGYFPNVPSGDVVSPYTGVQTDGAVFNDADGGVGFMSMNYDMTQLRPLKDYRGVPAVSVSRERFSMSQEAPSNLDDLRGRIDPIARFMEMSKATKTSKDAVLAEMRQLVPDVPVELLDAIYEKGDRGGRDLIDKMETDLANEPAGPGSKKRISSSRNRYKDDPRLAGMDIVEEMFGYMSTPNEVTDQVVNELIDRYGLTGAAEVAESNRLAPEVKVALTDKLLLHFNKMAEDATNMEQKQEYYYLAKRMMSSNILYLRSLGRGIQAASMYNKMSLEGFMMAAQKEYQKHKDKLAARYKNQIAAANALIDKVRANLKDKVINAKLLEQFAAGELADKQKMYDRKSYMKKKLKSMNANLGGSSESFSAVGGLSPQEMADWGLIKFLEGTKSRELWVNEMMNELGITMDQANDIYDNQDFNGVTLNGLNELRQAHKYIGTPRLFDLLKMVYNEADAAVMAAQLNEQFRQEALEVIKKANNKTFKGLKYGKILSAFEAAYELGFAPDMEQISDAIAVIHDVEPLNQDDIDKIRTLFKLADAEPNGRLKSRMIMEAYRVVHNKYRKLPASEVFWANYYANMLSGPGTQLLNIADNAVNIGMETFISSLQAVLVSDARGISRFKAFISVWDGMLKGLFGNGINDAKRVITGEDPMYGNTPKFFEDSTLEYMSSDWMDKPVEGDGVSKVMKMTGKKYLVAEAFVKRYVSRMLSASDAAFQSGFFDMSVRLTAAKQLRESVKNGEMTEVEAAKVFKEITGENMYKEAFEDAKVELEIADTNKQMVIEDLREKMEDATDPAMKESYRKQYEFAKSKYKPHTASDVTARATEIRRNRIAEMSPNQSDDIVNQAYSQALFGTYLNPPQGLLGAIVGRFGDLQSSYPSVRFVMPFLNVVANVINRQLDYTPLGYARAFNLNGGALLSDSLKWSSNPRYSYGGGIDSRSIDADKKIYKATIGLMAFAALLLASYDADEEDEFVIFGAGPRDEEERKKWMAAGYAPYTIKIGKRSFAYNFTPLSIMLGIIGNIGDSRRYGNYDEQETVEKAMFSFNLVGSTIMASSFLKSGVDFMNYFASGRESSNSFFQFLTRIGSTALVSSATRTVYKSVNPMEYEAKTLSEYFIRNTVVATHTLKPAIDVFGNEIKKTGVKETGPGRFIGEITGLNRFVMEEKLAPEYKAARELNIDATFLKSKVWLGYIASSDFTYEAQKVMGKVAGEILVKSKDYMKEGLKWPPEGYEEDIIDESKTKKQKRKFEGTLRQEQYNYMLEATYKLISVSILDQWEESEEAKNYELYLPTPEFMETKVDWDRVYKETREELVPTYIDAYEGL